MLKDGFRSSSSKTPEFIIFANEFKKEFARELKAINAKITAYNVGHFYISGFFRVGENCFYFSLSDVRSVVKTPLGMDFSLLYRTAKDEKDFTGGPNKYVQIEGGMARKMKIFPLAIQG